MNNLKAMLNLALGLSSILENGITTISTQEEKLAKYLNNEYINTNLTPTRIGLKCSVKFIY